MADRSRVTGRVRLADVAEAAGVSKGVASRILNGDTSLSARNDTRKRVVAVARQLGYTPHFGAKALAHSRTNAIALVLDDLANPFYSPLIKGALSAARDAAYSVMITEEPEAHTLASFEAMVTSGQVDGLMLGVTLAHEDSLQWSRETRIPHVFVNRRVPGAGRDVFIDHESAARTAMTELRDLGHERVLHLRGPRSNRPSDERSRGIKDVAAKSAMQVSTIESRIDVQDAAAVMGEHLSSPPDWTAVVVDTWMQVLGARAAILRAGYRVPDDFSVVVCDDLPLADFLVPPQATVSLPVYELGEASVRSLLAQIQGGTASDRRVETSPELNRRGSLAKYLGRSRQPNRLGVGGDQLAAVPAEKLG